jgi:hypothetical protein
MEALILVAESNGPTMFARIGVTRALNRHHVREFNPKQKEPHWGRRKLAATANFPSRDHRNEFLRAEPSTSLHKRHAQSFHGARNIYRPGDLSHRGVKPRGTRMEPHGRITDNIEIDHKTSRSICDEVGERLQRDLRLEGWRLPPYLNRLIDELRKREK